VVQPSDTDPTSHPMNNQIKALFARAPGLRPLWHVAKFELNTAKRRIDFKLQLAAVVAPRVRRGLYAVSSGN